MAKNRRGGRRGTTFTPVPPSQATPPPAPTGTAGGAFIKMTDTDAQTLRDEQDSSYNGNVTAAIKEYISGSNPSSPAANIDGQGHSLSQTMNFLLERGEDLQTADVNQINKKYGLRIPNRWFASMQHADAYMQAGAHDLGKNYNLVRLAHDDVLKNEFGISNYSGMTAAQLKAKLVGATFQNRSYLSTSYDIKKNPFGANSGQSGGREVIYNIKAGATTSVLMGNKAQAEIIIAKGENFKITDVRFTGNTATPRMGGIKQQIEIDIETY